MREIKHLEVTKKLLDMARENFEQHGELVPVAFAMTTDMIAVVAMDLTNDESKNQTIQVLRDLGSHAEVQAILTIVESWMLASGPADYHPDGDMLDGFPSVSAHPFRQEVIFASLESRTEGNITYTAEIKRDEQTGQPSLGDWIERKASKHTGRMAGYLS